jgi:hypothetical protein
MKYKRWNKLQIFYRPQEWIDVEACWPLNLLTNEIKSPALSDPSAVSGHLARESDNPW